jgi:hypothetical protein
MDSNAETEYNIFAKSFTNEPKSRRRGSFISGDRCLSFMNHLWEVHLKKCSYETLEFEFINFFQTNEDRVIAKYIGRPKKTVRSTGMTSTLRLNRDTGKMAQFQYFNTGTVPAKKGLMERLGYIFLDKEDVTIHHERMSYYTEQTSLESANPLPETDESSKSSIHDLRVCPVLDQCEAIPQGERARENRFEKVVSLNVVEGGRIGGRKKEEEVIDSTHTNPYHATNMPDSSKLTPEERAILHGK